MKSNTPRQDTPARDAQFECVFLSNLDAEFETITRLLEPAGIRLHRAAILDQADFLLTVTEARVLLADPLFLDGTWKEAQAMLDKAHPQVALVLAADNADERFWLDALDQGVYDVVLRPFLAEELQHVLENANAHAPLTARSAGGAA